ncbi:MORN repeat protein [anaerobic digester metagenome]
MKTRLLIMLTMSLLISNYTSGQEKCEVMKSSISGSYTGGCKKGLAEGKGTAQGIDHYTGQFSKGLPHGKGTYTWSTGEVYDGNWKKGKRHGIGTYSWFYQGRDTLSKGQWIEDQYAGPVYAKPRITQNSNIERYTIRKEGDINNRVLIGFIQNGLPNTSMTNLMLASSSGYQSSLGPLTGYEGVAFPVTINVRYTTMNRLQTATYEVRFEFEISEPGDWRVTLYN